MKAYRFVTLTLAVCSISGAQSWNHDPASPEGPGSWGFLGAYNGFATCGTDKQAVGTRQTPINIQSKAAVSADLPALQFKYLPSELIVENLTHVIEVVNEEAASSLLTGPGLADKYKLLQFHFHTPSEHKIDNSAAEMELHLVHQNALGELAVVGVMLKADDSKANPLFDRIVYGAPQLSFFSLKNTASAPLGEFDPVEMRPEKRTYFNYSGSLTTPPCSEGVHWYVLTEPAFISAHAVTAFQRLLANNNRYPYNNRPIQPGNNRAVLVSH
jgi:carbonic anhydrase